MANIEIFYIFLIMYVTDCYIVDITRHTERIKGIYKRL